MYKLGYRGHNIDVRTVVRVSSTWYMFVRTVHTVPPKKKYQQKQQIHKTSNRAFSFQQRVHRERFNNATVSSSAKRLLLTEGRFASNATQAPPVVQAGDTNVPFDGSLLVRLPVKKKRHVSFLVIFFFRRGNAQARSASAQNAMINHCRPAAAKVLNPMHHKIRSVDRVEIE